ncbi:MAG: DUF1657 domain-containing protein [Bacillota bacterium]|uniref:DUF1657 domain-containing protein n=1 Tax=Thermanaerosceptrum fracticalcis TaxID=1712410 RepID=A0A7G6DZ23_THEFR|nr:DUF1657 domain-containing protein [Thermanaerosceptrum fracticalcis]QNB45077.1 DUF1657 domain-containing protein [Thermanaerosceptrum fracticalcis]
MTIGTKMHQTLATLESAAANMKSFALDTEDKTAKQMFAQYAQQLESICQGMSARCDYIEQQEPQYKVFNQAMQPQQQQQNNQQKNAVKTRLQ